MDKNQETLLQNDLELLIDPVLKKTLKDTNGLKFFNYDSENDIVTLIIAVGKKDDELIKQFRRDITEIVKINYHVKGLKLEIEEHKTYEGITRRPITFIGIVSGKGGVGKSTVCANLAYRFMKKGYQVGVIDADIYGSSLPTILEIERTPLKLNDDKKIIPLKKQNMEVISTEFFTQPNQAVIWRGGMLNSMVDHFFNQVAWNPKMTVCFIDMPPGTGDIALDIHNFIPQAKMILVTTPHPSAASVASKAGQACHSMNHELLGVIENMSYYLNPANSEKEFIFGFGGGEKVAKELQTEFLCQIPINQPIHNLSLYEIDEEIGQIYDDVADELIFKLNIQK